MKVVVAIDSFKGSMTSIQAGMACKEGILAAIPKADVVVRPRRGNCNRFGRGHEWHI